LKARPATFSLRAITLSGKYFCNQLSLGRHLRIIDVVLDVVAFSLNRIFFSEQWRGYAKCSVQVDRESPGEWLGNRSPKPPVTLLNEVGQTIETAIPALVMAIALTDGVEEGLVEIHAGLAVRQFVECDGD
jgi:hypothetical protein